MRRIESLAARIAARLAATAALGLTAGFGLTGCCYYELRDSFDDCSLNIRNGYLARRAWCRCGDGDHPYGRAYKDGFLDGYSSVAAGGDGSLPSMPPRGYWSCCNSGPGCEGQATVNAYFEGYARGAICAEKDGVSASVAYYHRAPCPGVCTVPGYGMPPGPMAPVPAGSLPPGAVPSVGPVIGPASPPPPAPPSIAPATPADEAYETYNEGGLYE
jgi:hypothetical protein